ncbi:MAG: M14 family zinc carboxypeptidase [Planctomycetota bacterium]|nr:M14 family zinc carboxypeptidase [Planctomycetota bacterium]
MPPTVLLSCAFMSMLLITSATVADSVVRTVPASARDLRVVMHTAKDIWSHSVGIGPVDIVVDDDGKQLLDGAGVDYCVLIDDLEALIAEEAARLAQQDGGIAGVNYFDDFRPLPLIHQRLAELAQGSQGIASEFSIGLTLEGRDIRGLRISTAPAGSIRPALFVDGCQHAREWATPTVTMWIADRLISGWQSADPVVTSILSSFDVFVIPVVNGDGYEHSWTTNRLWRKNRRDNGDGTFGVDLNRNWGFMWGGPGSSGATNSETYRGVSPWSEPETQAMRDFILLHPEIVAAIDFHSYSQLILWPYGWTASQLPANNAVYQQSTAAIDVAIESAHGMVYTAGPVAPTLYVADGSAVDWLHETAEACAWTIEVRDTGAYGFIMPVSEIIPNAEENYAAFLAMAQWFQTNPATIELASAAPSIIESNTLTSIAFALFESVGSSTSPPILHTSVNGVPFQTQLATSLGNGQWSATLPSVSCGSTIDWFLTASMPTAEVRLPLGTASVFSSTAQQIELIAQTECEAVDGWTAGIAGDTATAGVWVLATPVATTAQTGSDHSPIGTKCWITGQHVSGGAGTSDLDGGITTLVTAPFNSSDPDTIVSFYGWWSNNLGSSPGLDSMVVEIENAQGGWVVALDILQSTNAWANFSFRVGDVLTSQPAPTASRVRFVARDLGAGSLVEAAIDDFRVSRSGCTTVVGDLNGDSIVNGADLGLLLAAWGVSTAGDVDGNGVTDGQDLALILGAWSL